VDLAKEIYFIFLFSLIFFLVSMGFGEFLNEILALPSIFTHSLIFIEVDPVNG
jgi:hypothetical protein